MLGVGRIASAIILGSVMAGCATQFNTAINKLDAAWKESNDQTLEREGRRKFDVSRGEAFAAARASVRRMGMVIEQQDPQTGFMLVTAPAPSPLSGAEWAEVQKSDSPKMRAILGEDLGALSAFAKLDPSNRDILANLFVTDKDGGVEVSLSFRIQDRNPASDRAKRMQAPPTAVILGVRKFWSIFEEELRATARATPPTAGPGRPPLATPGAVGTAQPPGGRQATGDVARAQELALQAQTALKDGQYVTALPMAIEALGIRERLLGPSHVDVASSLNTLGEVYRGQGRLADADRAYRRALAIRERELGPNHPEVAETLNNLGMLYNAEAKYAEAESVLKRAALTLDKAGDRSRPARRLQADVLENLARVYRAQGRSAEADETLARATLIWMLE